MLGNTWENLKSRKCHLESCGLKWQGAGLSEKHPLGVLAGTLASDKGVGPESDPTGSKQYLKFFVLVERGLCLSVNIALC